MNETIDLCFLHADTFLEEYALNNLLNKTNCKLNVIQKKLEGSYADCMNEMIEKCSAEHVVFFQSNTLVDQDWCEDMLYFNKKIMNSGCVGIYDVYNDKLKNKPLLTVDDDLKNVWVSENNIIDGTFMIKRSILMNQEIGQFDRLFDHTGFSQEEFTLKVAFYGHNNFYVRKQTSVPMEIANRINTFPKKTKEGIQLLNAFIKANINFNHNEEHNN